MAEAGPKMRLGEMLLDEGIITPEQLQRAIAYQKEKGVLLGKALSDLGFVAQDVIMAFVGTQLGIPHVDLAQIGTIAPEVLRLIPEQTCIQKMLIPIQRQANRLMVAMVDPLNVLVIDDIKLTTGCDVDPVIATEAGLKFAMEKYFGADAARKAEPGGGQGTTEMAEFMENLGDTGAGGDMEVLEEEKEETDMAVLAAQGEQAPVVRLGQMLITEAVRAGASDIHIEPFEKNVRVRYRIDGVMREVQNLPKNIGPALVSYLKIQATMDIAERRKAQDGKIHAKVLGKEKDFRVNIIPTVNGEKVCIRILDPEKGLFALDKLGMLPPVLEGFKKAINAPVGLILVTGPTGSGKTSTLNSALVSLNSPDINISTVENPVEFKIAGINQVQVQPGVVEFADALRAFLRQDPDIILVGEIRDGETAHIAIEAALTGHLVFGTLHTNDATQAVTRLGQMGIEKFLIASTLNMVVGQRLMRRICSNCKEAYQGTDEEWQALSIVPKEFRREDENNRILYRGAGCQTCNGTGMKGRMAIHEVLFMNEELQQLIVGGESSVVLRQAARAHGMVTLREVAAIRALNGDTTIGEVISEAKED